MKCWLRKLIAAIAPQALLNFESANRAAKEIAQKETPPSRGADWIAVRESEWQRFDGSNPLHAAHRPPTPGRRQRWIT